MSILRKSVALSRTWPAFVLAGLSFAMVIYCGLLTILISRGQEFGPQEISLSLKGILTIAIALTITGPSVLNLGLRFLEKSRISKFLGENILFFSAYFCGYLIIAFIFVALPTVLGVGPSAYAIETYGTYAMTISGVIISAAVIFSAFVFAMTLKIRN